MVIFTNVTNLVYSSQDMSRVNCFVQIEGVDGSLPFTADKNDPENYGAALYQDIVNGKYGPVSPYSPS